MFNLVLQTQWLLVFNFSGNMKNITRKGDRSIVNQQWEKRDSLRIKQVLQFNSF